MRGGGGGRGGLCVGEGVVAGFYGIILDMYRLLYK